MPSWLMEVVACSLILVRYNVVWNMTGIRIEVFKSALPIIESVEELCGWNKSERAWFHT